MFNSQFERRADIFHHITVLEQCSSFSKHAQRCAPLLACSLVFDLLDASGGMTHWILGVWENVTVCACVLEHIRLSCMEDVIGLLPIMIALSGWQADAGNILW
jgi:hypothetical protein